MSTGDWVLIDAGNIIVHLFRPEVREFYALEKMWGVDVGAETVSVGDDAPLAANA
jgi:ribosome-associated protein